MSTSVPYLCTEKLATVVLFSAALEILEWPDFSAVFCAKCLILFSVSMISWAIFACLLESHGAHPVNTTNIYICHSCLCLQKFNLRFEKTNDKSGDYSLWKIQELEAVVAKKDKGGPST